jgi:hypothetical protein
MNISSENTFHMASFRNTYQKRNTLESTFRPTGKTAVSINVDQSAITDYKPPKHDDNKEPTLLDIEK